MNTNQSQSKNSFVFRFHSSLSVLSDFMCFPFFRCVHRNDSFVDPTPEIQAELQAELERVAKVR